MALIKLVFSFLLKKTDFRDALPSDVQHALDCGISLFRLRQQENCGRYGSVLCFSKLCLDIMANFCKIL
jgi:hypothetical protein